MARPLRIQKCGAWYHLTARGNERRAIYQDQRDRNHFCELLAELVERYWWRIHAYVLMDNHYHLMVETAEANLSRGMQWLNVSYSVWFNRRHQRVGHLFQARYRAFLIDRLGWGGLGGGAADSSCGPSLDGVGGLDYTAVSLAVKRFEQRRRHDKALQSTIAQVDTALRLK